jgi:hypothetical protein
MHKEGGTQCHLSLLEKYTSKNMVIYFGPPYVCAHWVNTATLCILPPQYICLFRMVLATSICCFPHNISPIGLYNGRTRYCPYGMSCICLMYVHLSSNNVHFYGGNAPQAREWGRILRPGTVILMLVLLKSL